MGKMSLDVVECFATAGICVYGMQCSGGCGLNEDFGDCGRS